MKSLKQIISESLSNKLPKKIKFTTTKYFDDDKYLSIVYIKSNSKDQYKHFDAGVEYDLKETREFGGKIRYSYENKNHKVAIKNVDEFISEFLPYTKEIK